MALVLVMHTLLIASLLFTGANAQIFKKKDRRVSFESRVKLAYHYKDGELIVSETTEGKHQWRQKVGIAPENEVQFTSGRHAVVGVVGKKFIYFNRDDETFYEEVVTRTTPETRALGARGFMAAAVMGDYFVVAKSGFPIQKLYIESGIRNPRLAVSRYSAVAIMGNHFVGSDGHSIDVAVANQTDEKPLIMATEDIGAALLGDFFMSYTNSEIISTYVPGRSPNDNMAKGSFLIVASIGSHFVVLDGVRRKVTSLYVGEGGKVEIDQAQSIATLRTPYGNVITYSSRTGKFSKR